MGTFLDDELAELKATLGSEFMQNIAEKDDLGLVIATTSLLDKFIGIVIMLRFQVDITARSYERVFGFNGPLGTFAAKIDLGAALGVVIGDMAHDLGIMRKLRNEFAHAVYHPQLADGVMSARCKSLRMRFELSDAVKRACKTDERSRLVETTASLLLHLAAVIQRGMVEREFVKKHSQEINEGAVAAFKESVANANVTAPPT